MGLLGEILCWARLHAWRKIYVGSKNQPSGVCDSTAVRSSPQRNLNILYAKAITPAQQWLEG